MNPTEAGLMIKACKEAKVKLGVGYRLYYEPNHLQAISLASQEKYGKVKMIESSLGFTVPAPDSWRLDKKKGGGAIMDLGVYAIQAVRRAAQEFPFSVTAQAFTFDKVNFKDTHETVFWQFEFPNGIVSHSSTSYSFMSTGFIYPAKRDGLKLNLLLMPWEQKAKPAMGN